MNGYRSRAPIIKHHGEKPQDVEQCIHKMAVNTHLPARAVKLLKFYTSKWNGFIVHYTTTEKETGIPKNKISDVRDQLIIRNLIFYEPNDRITIQWDIIRGLAMLPKPLKMRGNTGKFYQMLKPEPERNKITMAKMAKRYRPRNQETAAQPTPDEKKFFDSLGKLTPEEYRTVSLALFGQEPPLEYPSEYDERPVFSFDLEAGQTQESPELDEYGRAWADATPQELPFNTMTVEEWERQSLPYVDHAWIDNGEIDTLDILTASPRLKTLQQRDGTPQNTSLRE